MRPSTKTTLAKHQAEDVNPRCSISLPLGKLDTKSVVDCFQGLSGSGVVLVIVGRLSPELGNFGHQARRGQRQTSRERCTKPATTHGIRELLTVVGAGLERQQRSLRITQFRCPL